MRSLTATLLAAQQQATRVPYVSVIARNRLAGVLRLKWNRLYTGAEPDCYHAVTVAGDGSLIRVRVGLPEDNGKLYLQRVANPGPSSDFSQWAYTGQYSCLAVAVTAQGASVDVFWSDLNDNIRHLHSSDYGVTWGIAQTIDAAPSPGVYGIATTSKANGDLAVFFTNGTSVWVKRRVGGQWQEKTAWDNTTGALTSVAAVYDGDWNLLLAGQDVAGNPRVWSLVYGDGTALLAERWSGLKVLASAPAGGDFAYGSVSLSKSDVYRAFYIEAYSGIGAYSRPYWTHVVKDTGYLAGLWREPVLFDLSSQNGLAIAHVGSYAWLSCPSGVWRASMGDSSLDISADVLAVRMESKLASGGLTVELRNNSGQYRNPGQGSLALLVPGAEIEFGSGYLTAAGNETSSGPTFWLQSYEHFSGVGRAVLVLHAIDGWGLLAGWRARNQFRWNQNGQEASVKDILSFVVGRVGLKLEMVSESPVAGGFHPDFTIHPGDSGPAIVSRLLSVVPDVLFVEGCSAFLVYPQSSDGSAYSYGGSHVIMEGQYGSAAPATSHVRVEGWDVGQGEPVVSEVLGDRPEVFPERWLLAEDRNIATVEQAYLRGQVIMRKAGVEGVLGTITTPVNCGLQMYDVVEVTDMPAGLAAAVLRVTGIVLSYRPARGEYTQQVSLGGV